MTTHTYSFLALNLIIVTTCLDLKSRGIEDIFYTSSMTVFRTRAFLTLPRSSCYNNVTNPSLIEVHWNAEYQNLVPGRKLFFPNEKHQQWGKCDQLQNAVSVDMEVKKGRLWVLDQGTNKCTPKIIIYNLPTNMEIQNRKFDSGIDRNVNCLVVDSFGKFGPAAYIGHSEGDQLTVFSYRSGKMWTMKVVFQRGLKKPSTGRLILSKSEPILYLTSDDGFEMFSINLSEIRQSVNSLRELREIKANFIGSKLGPTGGMTTDLAGGLNYYLTMDFAVVRWTTSKPLKAEYHDILKQSYEDLPYVSHLFSGPQNGIWALINPLPPKECRNITERRQFKISENIPHLPRRVIQLSKFIKKGYKENFLVFEKL